MSSSLLAWKEELKFFILQEKVSRYSSGSADNGSKGPAARITPVEVALYHLLDDRPKEAVLPLEPTIIFLQEALEMMKEHFVEDSPLQMRGRFTPAIRDCVATDDRFAH